MSEEYIERWLFHQDWTYTDVEPDESKKYLYTQVIDIDALKASEAARVELSKKLEKAESIIEKYRESVSASIPKIETQTDLVIELETRCRELEAKLEKARELFSYEIDINGCSDEIAMADTSDEHEQAVEKYVVDNFDEQLAAITAESIKEAP
jgi:hypothetical protein